MPNPPQGVVRLRIWLICRALTITGGSTGVCVRLDRILHVLALLNVDRSEGPKGMAQRLGNEDAFAA